MFKFNKSSGQVSRLLLVLAIVVLVAAVITFLVIRMAEKPTKPAGPTPTPTVPLPVYEQVLDNIRFVYESAINRGNVLKATDAINKQYYSLQDLHSNEKIIQVTVGAQNKGIDKTSSNAWNIENIVDSEGRNYEDIDNITGPWLPNPNFCGAVLKPDFDPLPCTKIYEVSKESTGLKIRVEAGKDSTLLDLIVK